MTMKPIIEKPNTKTSLNKTKAEIIYELIKTRLSSNIQDVDVVSTANKIYNNMVQSGIIIEYPTYDYNYAGRDL